MDGCLRSNLRFQSTDVGDVGVKSFLDLLVESPNSLYFRNTESEYIYQSNNRCDPNAGCND